MAASFSIRRVFTAAMVGAMIMTVSQFSSAARGEETVRLGELDLSKMTAGWGEPVVDLSVQKKPLAIAGQKFERGVGTHADSVMYVELSGGSKSFSAYVGVDDEVGGNIGSIEFRIYGDGKLLWSSGIMKAGEIAKKVDVDVSGVKTLALTVNSAGDGVNFDHAGGYILHKNNEL